MKVYRLFGLVAGILLAIGLMASGAYAHGPFKHAPPGTQAAQAGFSVADPSLEGAMKLEWTNDAHHHSASSDCSGEANGECCSHHCCTGTPAVAETRSPALAMGMRVSQAPPDAPRERTPTGLLRPPCR
jgi:hypothetical protein